MRFCLGHAFCPPAESGETLNMGVSKHPSETYWQRIERAKASRTNTKMFSCVTLIAFLTLGFSAVGPGQKSGTKSDAMSPQFKEQARKAFHAIQRIDPYASTLQSQSAHRAVNGLVDTIKAPLDKYVRDILFTWLAEIEMGHRDVQVHPASARRWMAAEAECQTEAMFYFDFNGLTEEGQKNAAQHVAQQTCLATAKGLPR